MIMGQVLMAGQGQVPARQAAVKAGIPLRDSVGQRQQGLPVGPERIYLADQMIAAGEADIVVAGGMESMTNAPYLAAGARGGFRYGNAELADAIVKDGLWCAFDACLMGVSTERYTAGGISREAQDDLAVAVPRAGGRRHQGRAVRRRDRRGGGPAAQGRPAPGRDRRGRAAGHHRASRSARLRAAFDEEGTITAGNASQLSDGGSAIVVMSKAEAERRGVGAAR